MASSRIVQLVSNVTQPQTPLESALSLDQLASAKVEADKRLEKVVEALGGAEALNSLRGYHEQVIAESGVGPSIETDTVVRWQNRMKQTNRVLATTIESRFDTEGGSEESGPQRVSIPIDEARARLAATARHPAAIIARWLRREIAFRQLTLRMVGDRELVVLEEVTDAMKI